MKKYIDTMNQIKKNNEKIVALSDFIKNYPFDFNAADIHAEIEKKKMELGNAANNKQVLEIENKILLDNARRELISEALPAIIETLSKYNGKPYGDKTREKIYNELKEKTGCGVRLCRRYDRPEVCIYPATLPGTYNVEVTISTGYNSEKILDHDNKIRFAEANEFTIDYISPYVENPHAHAKKILKEFEKLKKSVAAVEKQMSEFGNMLPSKMDRPYLRSWKNYLV